MHIAPDKLQLIDRAAGPVFTWSLIAAYDRVQVTEESEMHAAVRGEMQCSV